MQRSVKALLYVLLIMESTAHQCDKATVKDCARFTQYLTKLGKVSQHESALNYCHVLVETPMTFYEASVACTNAGGHLSRLFSKHQIAEFYEHAKKHGLKLSASTRGEGVYVTTCWPRVPTSQFSWAKGNEPHSALIPEGASLTVCSEDGHSSRLCWELDEDYTKLPFFCGLDVHQGESEEDIHETVNELRVSVITVMSVFMGLVVISMFIFGVAYCKRSKPKARAQNLEAAQGSEQKDAQLSSTPALPMGPPPAEVAQFGQEGSQPAAEGGQPAAEGGQPAAEGGQPAAEGGQPAAEGGQAGAKAGAEDAPSKSSRSPM